MELHAHLLSVSLLLIWRVVTGQVVRSRAFVMQHSYNLTQHTAWSVADSDVACAVQCSAERCAAYQWHAHSGACYRQHTLNVTAAAGHSIGVRVTDCAAILETDPSSVSGIYTIPVSAHEVRQVWCDMATDGGGWTVFLQRLDGSVDFNVARDAYKAGFGDAGGEYWLGLEALHFLTSSNNYQLRADLSDWDDVWAHALYDSMAVAGEDDGYKLALGAFLGGEAGDGLRLNGGKMFSTKDMDLDDYDGHCAQKFKGGFWFHSCLEVHPTGRYFVGGDYTADVHVGMQWRSWMAHRPGHYYSMKTMQLKIRPR